MKLVQAGLWAGSVRGRSFNHRGGPGKLVEGCLAAQVS